MYNLQLLRPYFLLLLLPSIALLILCWRKQWHNSSWSKVIDAHLQTALLASPALQKFKSLMLAAAAVAWLVAIIALAGPSFKQQTLPAYQSLTSTVLVLDLSTAMNTQDIKPNRLTRAKFKIQDFIKQIKQGQIGLVAYSGYAYAVSPLTGDAHTLKVFLDELSPTIMPTKGDNLKAGLIKAQQLLDNGNASDKHILVFTNNASALAINTAQQLARKGITTSVIGLGTLRGAPMEGQTGFVNTGSGAIEFSYLHPRALRKLANAGKGYYSILTANNSDIKPLLIQQNQEHNQTAIISNTTTMPEDSGYWLLLALLPLALFARKGVWEQLH